KITCIRGIDIHQSGSIVRQLTKQICQADITITDITSANPNVLLELGIRLAVSASLNVLICHEGVKIPFNLTDHRCVTYSMGARGYETAKNEIVKFIQEYLNDTQPDANPYYRYVDLFTNRSTERGLLEIYSGTPQLIASLAKQVKIQEKSNRKIKTDVIE